MANEKVSLPSAVIRALAARAAEVDSLDAEIKAKSARVATLRGEIRDTVEQYAERVPLVGSSRIIPLSTVGRQIRVTYTTGTPGMDYGALQSKVGDQVFARITKATAWELDVDKVNRAIEREELKESDLVACVTEAPARKPSVYVDELRGATEG
jgi:hypothetical protein